MRLLRSTVDCASLPLAALTSRGSFILIAERGHNPPVEAADRVLAIVRDALRCARDRSACPAPNAR